MVYRGGMERVMRVYNYERCGMGAKAIGLECGVGEVYYFEVFLDT